MCIIISYSAIRFHILTLSTKHCSETIKLCLHFLGNILHTFLCRAFPFQSNSYTVHLDQRENLDIMFLCMIAIYNVLKLPIVSDLLIWTLILKFTNRVLVTAHRYPFLFVEWIYSNLSQSLLAPFTRDELS